MAVIDNLGDSRPPPSRQRSLNIFTPGIPWYRDLRVLRILAQLIFAVGLIGAILYIINNMTTNLAQSNIPVDFNTYTSPFTVAIPEGIDAFSNWTWAGNTNVIGQMTRLGWSLLVGILALMVIGEYRTERLRLHTWAAASLFVLAAFFLPIHDSSLNFGIGDVLVDYFNMDSGAASAIGTVLWLGIVAGALWLAYQLCVPNLDKLLPLGVAALLFAIAAIILPGDIENALDSTFIPDAILPVIAFLIWLIPLTLSFVVIGWMYMHEMIEFSTAIIMGAMVYLIVYIMPLDTAIAYNYVRAQEYLSGGTVTRAFITGIFNTIRVVIASLIASTILGILVGIGLLSSNWLVRNVSKVFVEIFRNTPLLIQLLFIYRTLTLLLPAPRESFRSPFEIGDEHFYYFNARGFYHPSITGTDTFVYLAIATILGLIAFFYIRRWRLQLQEDTGQPAKVFTYGLPALLVLIVIGWIIAGQPFNIEYPILPEDARNVENGTRLSVAFVALFLGLVFYTSAFIAEIVRAGIQSVPYGQIEAARASGLRGTQVLSLVVLPQALRLIIPPLGNQYVNLGKNSSLGLAVTYVETFRIAQLANNEKGQAVAFFAGLMLIYLALSLVLSFMTNLVNRSTRIRTR